MIEENYMNMESRLKSVRDKLDNPFTFAEKIIYGHLHPEQEIKIFKRGRDYVLLQPDRLAMQDATGQMALLQFMNTGKKEVALPSSIHCDHLITADQGACPDLLKAKNDNEPVYDFLQSVAKKYGIDYWKPGSGIIHQIILENYAFSGQLMLGTDSHTPNCGGLGMMGVGVGGADAVDIMANLPWELKMPKIFGIKLSGELQLGVSPKDVILHIAGLLKAKGGTNAILEYFGGGLQNISATGRATITNMGAEVGATTSLFPYDEEVDEFLVKTGRKKYTALLKQYTLMLQADDEVLNNPGKFYDKVLEINLNNIEPYMNGPFTPDAAYKAEKFSEIPEATEAPAKLSTGLIGSCTNSSYQDLKKVAGILKNAGESGIKIKSELIVNPGSQSISQICEEEGIFDIIREAGGQIMANACGPCIGQWNRNNAPKGKNTIITSFNRNFRKRNDGRPDTYAFLASPEIVTIMALAGKITFNPLKDKLKNSTEEIGLQELFAGIDDEIEMPAIKIDNKIVDNSQDYNTKVNISQQSDRVALLKPFDSWNGKDLTGLKLLIKTKGKCTTDHISQAGKWLAYRGNLDRISDNLLLGADNYYYAKSGFTKNQLSGQYEQVSAVARNYKNNGIESFIVAEENYGEGSSREHAAMEPRYLGVRVVIAKSFARIHETNLKKQGILALTFQNGSDYDKIKENDSLDLINLNEFAPGQALEAILKHDDGDQATLSLEHTYSELQIEWFKKGSAINWISDNTRSRDIER